MAVCKTITPGKKTAMENSIRLYKTHPRGNDRLNALAPHLLQQKLLLDDPVGASITRAKLVELLLIPNWDSLVVYMGLDEEHPDSYKHVAYLYDAAWNQVGIIGGGGGGGVTCNSVPPPNSPPPP